MGSSPLIRAGRLLGLVTATASVLVLGALPASAAPTNDTSATATPIASLPYSDTFDSTGATTDEEDAALNANCGAPATNVSVWYRIEQGDVPGYLVDVSGSDYLAGVIVATGTPGDLTLLTCGPDAVGFENPGQPVYVMAFSDDPAVTGGQFVIEVREGQPAPKISMSVDDVGHVDRRTGTATISGTYTCHGQADFVQLDGWLSQEQGDTTVNGVFGQQLAECGGTFDWSAEIVPESGKFTKGLSATYAATVGCSALGCNFYETLEVVRLRGGRG